MEFIELVQEMREYQKEYFRTRNQETLKWCKKLESQVDYAIANKNNLKLF